MKSCGNHSNDLCIRVTPQNVHIVIPGTFECVILHGRGIKVANQLAWKGEKSSLDYLGGPNLITSDLLKWNSEGQSEIEEEENKGQEVRRCFTVALPNG